MPQLIQNRATATDSWQTLALAEGETPAAAVLPEGDVIFPLAVWQARKQEIIARGQRIGLVLQPDERVEEIAADLGHFAVVAVNFPKFVDGRGYSTAALLRQRYGYTGELRAVGDVLHDQLFFFARVGFDSYALKDGKNLVHAIERGFTTFSEGYQASTSQPAPLFRRRA